MSADRARDSASARWREVTTVVDAALALPPAERIAYVRRICANDADLGSEVESLLAACERAVQSSHFMAGPANSLVDSLLAELAGRDGGRPDAADDIASSIRDHYVIEREIGRGGMATVYLARDVRHDRRVALKVVRPEVAALLATERFLREIRIAARLIHPHILPLYDSGEVAGVLYYVMPYVIGETLRHRLARERQLPVAEAVRIVRQIADALDYAHRQGVVHRDIKPENILLEDGHAVVADFGIARAITVSGEGASPGSLTASGVSLGTPAYMSPEQVAADRAIDGRSDVYALGCVLHELLAGEPPFRGPTAESVARQHLTAPPPSIVSLRPSVPTVVAHVVARALAKAPADRFQTAHELASALSAVREAASTPELRPGMRRSWQRPIALGVLALALLSVAAGVRLVRDRPIVLAVDRTTQLTHDPELELDPALSPDGRFVAYSAGGPDDRRIYVRQVDGGRAIALTDASSERFRSPQWSPDGNRIVFHSQRGVYVVGTLGGPARRVAVPPVSATLVNGATWSPDGKAIAFATESELLVVPEGGGATRGIAAAPSPHSPSWSPDGSWLAFVSGNSEFGSGLANVAPSVICIVPANGGRVLTLTNPVTSSASPAWMPDGRTLLYISSHAGGRDIYALRLKRDGTAEGSPVRLTSGLQTHKISLSADGRRLVYGTLRKISNIWWLDVSDRKSHGLADAKPLTRGDQIVESMSLSPDGRWLAFDSNVSGNQDIYRMPASGGDPERLTTDRADDFAPTWSPDAREIAFYSTRDDGTRRVFLMNADGSAQRRVTRSPGLYPDWSPDGRRIVYCAVDGLGLIERDSAGSFAQPHRLTETGCFPRWSPDGRWILYADGRGSVRIITPDGGESHAVVSGVTEDAGTLLEGEWSRDGRTVFYKRGEPAGGWSLHAVAIPAGGSRLVLRVDDPTHPGADVFATDGHRLYFGLNAFESDLWLLTLRTQ